MLSTEKQNEIKNKKHMNVIFQKHEIWLTMNMSAL